MNKITEQLWIGDLADADSDKCAANGITAILSCIMPDEHYFVYNPAGLPNYRIHINDAEPYPEMWLSVALRQLKEWIAEGKVVLVHCGMGISRSASTCIAYLMQAEGLTWDEALDRVKAARPIIMPHIELKKAILQYFQIYPYDGSYDAGPQETR